MLSLSRNVGEKIMIGDNIELVILRVDGGQVKIGIQAPANVHILREELVEGFKPMLMTNDIPITMESEHIPEASSPSSGFIEGVKKVPAILFKKKRVI